MQLITAKLGQNIEQWLIFLPKYLYIYIYINLSVQGWQTQEYFGIVSLKTEVEDLQKYALHACKYSVFFILLPLLFRLNTQTYMELSKYVSKSYSNL